mmetsp:Transcript_22148/g.71727  ORF Transcript_22148/g.71727 Transcript_22148/m.71727 type:complete len:504 (-) Transcript_22148:1065-2576(-)
MANRGMVITVKAEGPNGEEKTHRLQCGRHAPLFVLRAQLSHLTGIAPKNQVLIYRDKSDKDGNSDELLDGEDRLLGQLVPNEALLTLHTVSGAAKLGTEVTLTPEEQAVRRKRELEDAVEWYTTRLGKDKTKFAYETVREPVRAPEPAVVERPPCSVATIVPPARANHSFNGVAFDIESRGPYELTITSIHIGGMLGCMRVWSRDCSWCYSSDGSSGFVQNIFGAHYVVEPSRWRQVAEEQCAPAWDQHRELVLAVPVVVPPRTRRGMYIHSNLPDDLGLQYQSYHNLQTVALDEYIAVHPGAGHTSCIPFDNERGWWRVHRGPAGMITYTARLKRWTKATHEEFPSEFKASVKACLLAQHRAGSPLSALTVELLLQVLQLCAWDHFDHIPGASGSKRASKRASAAAAERGNDGSASFISRAARMAALADFDDEDDDDDGGDDDDDDFDGASTDEGGSSDDDDDDAGPGPSSGRRRRQSNSSDSGGRNWGRSLGGMLRGFLSR